MSDAGRATPDSPERAAPLEYAAVLQSVRGLLAELIKGLPDTVSPDAILLQIGAQSMDFIDLVVRLETRFAIKLPAECAIPDQHTIDTYVHAVLRATAESQARI